MWRKRAALAFLVILVSYAIFVAWTVHEHQLYVKAYREEVEREYGVDAARWLDHEPYFERGYGQAAIGLGLAIFFVGFALAVHATPVKKSKVASLLLLVLLIGVLGCADVTVKALEVEPQASEPLTVNLLMYYDEEWLSRTNGKDHINWMVEQLSKQYPIIDSIYEKFRANWDISSFSLIHVAGKRDYITILGQAITH